MFCFFGKVNWFFVYFDGIEGHIVGIVSKFEEFSLVCTKLYIELLTTVESQKHQVVELVKG